MPGSARPNRTAPPAGASTLRKPVRPFLYNVRVRDIMTRMVISIGPRASLLDALVLMRSHRLSGLVVQDLSGQVRGVLSEHDIAQAMAGPREVPSVSSILDVLMLDLGEQPNRTFREYRSTLESTRVEESMSAEVLSASPEDTVEAAAQRMRQYSVHRLPVLDDARLVGIVTRHDLIAALVTAPPSGAPPEPSPRPPRASERRRRGNS